MNTSIIRFTAFRRGLSQLVAAGSVSHTSDQRNADDLPQYEGVVFSDGRCVLHWLTAVGSISVFDSLEAMLKIHGHPEYGTDIVWHDGDAPQVWQDIVTAYELKTALDREG